MSKQVVNPDGVVIPVFGGGAYIPKPKKKITSIGSPCGEPIIHRADLSIGEHGEKIAKVGEALDLDAMIQAALPSCDITAIVARAKMGDESVLHVNPGFVGDSVNLPKDLYDYKAMNDLYDKVAGSFDSLPPEIKALFDNKADVYLNSIISNKAETIIADYKASQQQEGGNDNA